MSRLGFDSYQRSLSGIERDWWSDTNRQYRELRKDALEIIDRVGLSQAGKAEIRSLYKALKDYSVTKAPEYAERIGDVTHQFATTQNRQAKVTAVVPRVIVEPDLFDARWIDTAAVRMASRLAMAGDSEEEKKLLFGFSYEGSRATAWRKEQNSIKSGLILALYAAGNIILNGIYDRMQVTQRQAVAAIDENTTDCCLQVHGQIVGLDEYFNLTGTPRFSDKKHSPPFHFACRTSVALYTKYFEEYTDEMIAAARAELRARAETGTRQVIHPAHATSRR